MKRTLLSVTPLTRWLAALKSQALRGTVRFCWVV